MIRDRGSWFFEGVDKWDYKKDYPAIRKSLKILMENLISSKILLPKTIDFDIPLVYDTVDELLDQIEASGHLESGSEFDIWGDTVIYTSNGEKVYEDIICIERFIPIEQYLVFVVRTDHWLPMGMDNDTYNFSWNLEQYQLNYHRIPALLKKLNEELGWKNKDLLYKEEWFVSLQAGYDFFLKESIITREYEANPNPDFDLEAYLATIKKAKEQYSR